jgi:hypothetical protein
MQRISLNEERNIMRTTRSKKTWIIIIAVVVIAVIISLVGMQAAHRKTNYMAQLQSSSQNDESIPITPSAIVIVSAISKTPSSSHLSSTSVAINVTQSKASYTSSKITPSKTESVSSKVTSSKISVSSKVSIAISSSALPFPPVPTSQAYVTKTVGSNTIRLNVNAFTFEAYVDWSSVQQYLLDEFYVKVYKNGVLQGEPSLYGCVTKEPTNTVAVEIDTYKSNGHWYIEPATYTIECYCQLGEHSMITENRPNIVPCPSASFTVAINERGFS